VAYARVVWIPPSCATAEAKAARGRYDKCGVIAAVVVSFGLGMLLGLRTPNPLSAMSLS